jgi:hypothetical protein
VYSGFNKAFKEYFPQDDPIAVTNQLAAEKVITLNPCKKGVVIYVYGEGPKGSDPLAKILAD